MPRKQKKIKNRIFRVSWKGFCALKISIFGFWRDANRIQRKKISCIEKASVPFHPPHHHSDNTGLGSTELHSSVSSVLSVMLHSCQVGKTRCWYYHFWKFSCLGLFSRLLTFQYFSARTDILISSKTTFILQFISLNIWWQGRTLCASFISNESLPSCKVKRLTGIIMSNCNVVTGITTCLKKQVSTGGNPLKSGLWTVLLLLSPQDLNVAQHHRLHTKMNLFCKKRQFNKKKKELFSNRVGLPHSLHASQLVDAKAAVFGAE